MVWQRRLAILGLSLAAVVLLPHPTWAQADPEVYQSSRRVLDALFSDLLYWTVGAGLVSGVVTGFVLHRLRHRLDHFPSRVRRWAVLVGVILTVVCWATYLGAGVRRGIELLSILTHGRSSLIPLIFLALWYLAAYGAVRFSRWSGRYALWPRLAGGRS